MRKWTHRLSDIDSEARTAVCSNCGPVKLRAGGQTNTGKTSWKCRNSRIEQLHRREKPWVFFKKDCCQICAFVPEHPCQLDVDHIDGDKTNNDPSNLQTLCANCHRLKTYQNNDWMKKTFVVEPLKP